jgi:hypothetical protein
VCYILENNFSAFFPCPDTLSEAEFRCNVLINLVEEISMISQHSGCGMVTVAIFNQAYRGNRSKKETDLKKV